MSRNLLHKNKMEDFKAWLDEQGIPYRSGKGTWQELQVRMPGSTEYAAVYSRANMPEHLTVDRRLDSLVKRFCQHRPAHRREPSHDTTNKPGSVNQQPLYGCTSCYEDWTWPAGDLRVFGSECWCDLCWDERRWDFPDQPSWNDLEPYTPALQAECEKLRKDAELWESIHDEIHRRADKEHALADRCDFDVTIMYEDYAAIDAAMAGGEA